MSNADLPPTTDTLPTSFTANKQAAIKGILLNILLGIRQDHTTTNDHERTIFFQMLHCSHAKNMPEDNIALCLHCRYRMIRLADDMQT